eukprot:4071301-Amphidinium_carterae.2
MQPTAYLEALAAFNTIRHLNQNSANYNSRLVHLVDSKSVLGALCKGRASSRALNATALFFGGLGHGVSRFVWLDPHGFESG